MGLTTTPAQTLQSERTQYPGLLPAEILIFRAWLKQHEGEYNRFDYNLTVGEGVDPGGGFPDNLRQMYIRNTKLRIDAVGWQGEQPTIIEVKVRAGPGAVGQLLTYRAIWEADQLSVKPPLLLLVTDRLQPNVAAVLKRDGIAAAVVPVDLSSVS